MAEKIPKNRSKMGTENVHQIFNNTINREHWHSFENSDTF